MSAVSDFRSMRHAILDTPISAQLYREAPSVVEGFIREPAQPWVVRGPRGGRYLAVPPFRFRGVSADVSDYFIRNRVVARWESSGTRYIRPRSRLAREVDSLLGGS